MALILHFALTVASAATFIPVAVLFIELVKGSTRPSVQISVSGRPIRHFRTAVLMPAHNEAEGINEAIASVLHQLQPNDRLVVVADNCTDETAKVARAAGAEVVERHDTQRRGKGYALDFGVRWLEKSPPGITIIIDADCIAQPGSIGRLAEDCVASGRPVQALYLMHAPAGSRLSMRIAEFAWLIKNKLRPLGSLALGWPCQLMGTGMAFPWPIIQRAPLATGHLVEDMQLGLDLAKAGTPPLFCPQALVTSSFPTDSAGAKSQRTRWEHGHLSVLTTVGPQLIWQALKTRNMSLLAMALDLMVPPLAALVLTLVTLLLLNTAWWFATGNVQPLFVSVLAAALVVLSVTLAWTREGRRIVSLGEMLALPWYVAAKIPVYIRLFTKRQVEWVRTKRD
jgi:cellulose synthase/poly-beta-1,6-N-acetylglucosamine synthase-like glycosyltransferase